VSGRNSLAAANRTDRFVKVDDRPSEVSRGRSRWMQAGEGLKALQSERRREQINRTVVPSKAQTVPGAKPGKWSGK